jgi:hypothetical protein
MSTMRLRVLVVFACCAMWWCGSNSAVAQVRGSGVSRPTVGGGRVFVGRGADYNFRQYSAGGGLRSSGGGYKSGGVLRSSMSSAPSSIGRGLRSSVSSGGGGTALRSGINRVSGGLLGRPRGGSRRAGSTVLRAPSKGGTLKGTTGFAIKSAGGKGMAASILGQRTNLAAARGFIASVGQSGSLKISGESIKTIKTLVPDQPGQYRDKMQRGEEFLRAGSFSSAYDQFKVASDIVHRSPEALLNLAHASFGSGSYRMTAFYIRRALACMPELPGVPLRPKRFYENIGVYGDMVIRLETYVDESPGDGDALLILAYFRWFDDVPDIPVVRSALERALAVAKSEERIEAIHIFWDAMVASGKVSGKLKTAATKPSDNDRSTTQPSVRADESDKAPRSSVQPAKDE